MALLKNKVCASTLMEVVVAMLITAICFSLAFATLAQLSAHQLGNVKLRAEREVSNLLEQTLQEKNFIADEMDFKDFYLMKKVENYPYSADLLQLKVTAYRPNGEILAERRRLLYESQDQ